jgi:hypothetical protein
MCALRTYNRRNYFVQCVCVVQSSCMPWLVSSSFLECDACGEPRSYIPGVIPSFLQNPWEEAVDVSSSPCFYLLLLMAAWAACCVPINGSLAGPPGRLCNSASGRRWPFRRRTGARLPSSMYRPDTRWTDGDGPSGSGRELGREHGAAAADALGGGGLSGPARLARVAFAERPPGAWPTAESAGAAGSSLSRVPACAPRGSCSSSRVCLRAAVRVVPVGSCHLPVGLTRRVTRSHGTLFLFFLGPV